MSRTIRLDDEARDEIIAAARYYDERERGRGELFSDAAFAHIERLSGFPNAGAPVWVSMAFCLLDGYGCGRTHT